MNLKGNTKIYLTVNLNPDTTWCRRGPIFPEVGVNSISGVRDVGDPTSNQTRIRSLQPLHHRSVLYQPSTTWLCSPWRFFLQANQRTQARRYKRAIWNCKYEWSQGKVGVQELDSKGLIDTVEEIKNRGPGSLWKDLSPQLQWINLSFTRKTRTNKTLTLIWRLLLIIWWLGRA